VYCSVELPGASWCWIISSNVRTIKLLTLRFFFFFFFYFFDAFDLRSTATPPRRKRPRPTAPL
jgi:hypothetical protein